MKPRRPGTLAQWLAYAARRFRAARLRYGHGTTNARDEAAWLLAHALRLPHQALEARGDQALARAEQRRIERLIERRIRSRKPLAYLLREAWLGEHRFYVDERAIVPRSHIAALLREKLHPWIARPQRVRRVLDLCTGSGCLAVLAALAFPRAQVDASDVSAAALAVARRNLRAYRLGHRVTLFRSDLFTALPRRRYDLIVANPPYVDARAMHALPREYRHEPRLALAGGADGLDHIRRILCEARRFLTPRGLLVMEIGRGRRRLERAFPRVAFVWPESVAGAVLVIERQALPLCETDPTTMNASRRGERR